MTGTGGVLVLPADLFFANGDAIITLVQQTEIGSSTLQKLPTFFFAPDWVRATATGKVSAFGAFGVSQLTCGANLAQTVSGLLKNPSGTSWHKAQQPSNGSIGDFTWTVNTTVANQLGLKPNSSSSGPTPVQ